MSDAPSPPHALLMERFELLRPLGQGAFCAVFEALDRSTRERVALKRLTTVDPAAVYRFKREFRMLADLRHPNVVRLRELLVDDGRWFLTMDHVPYTHLTLPTKTQVKIPVVHVYFQKKTHTNKQLITSNKL